MAKLRKVNKSLLEHIEKERLNIAPLTTASTHVMSREDYLSIYEDLFKYDSVQVTYNKEYKNEIFPAGNFVTVVIGF